MVAVDVCISSHLKEKLAWDLGKCLWISGTKMLFKNSKTTKEVKGLSHFKLLCTLLYGP